MKIAKKKPYKGSALHNPAPLVSTRINCYTDGSAMANGFGGPGTHAFVVVEDNKLLYEYAEGVESTTNNRQELEAVIACMKHIHEIQDKRNWCMVTIHTDSSYVFTGCTEWIYGWASRNFQRSGKPIPNADLWEKIWNQSLGRFYFNWVKGHDKNKWNNLADSLCREAYTESIRRTHGSKANPGSLTVQPTDWLEEWEKDSKNPTSRYSSNLLQHTENELRSLTETFCKAPIELLNKRNQEIQSRGTKTHEDIEQLQEVNNLLLDLYHTNYSHYARRIELYLIQHKLLEK